MQLSYLDAYYYKLLLEVGFIEDVNNLITSIAENNECLEGIYLDLVCSYGNNDKVISCLYNYIADNEIDDDALATRLRLFILEKYEKGSIDLYQVANSLTGFVNLTQKWHNKTFNDFSLIGDAYGLMFDGIMKKDKFEKKVINFLKTGEHIDYDSLFEKPTLKTLLKKEKQEMNKIRAFINYTIVPIILIVTILVLSINFILLTINEEKYTTLSIILFILLGVMYISLIASLPLIRKKELKIELDKYDFTINQDVKDEYIIYTKNSVVKFKNEGLFYEDKYYKYDDLSLQLLTSNHLSKVSIFVEINVKNDNSYIKPHWYIDLDNELLNAIVNYDIKLENYEKLITIINNKEETFKNILKYGVIDKI